MTDHPEAEAAVVRALALIEYDPNGGCWLWSGAPNSCGYGQLQVSGRPWRAHRYIYEKLVGPIPSGLQLDHLCRVRLCVNPAHLEPVNNRENVLRGVGRTAENARKTHCARGHEYTPENTRYQFHAGRPQRRCIICRRENNRQQKARARTTVQAKGWKMSKPTPEDEAVERLTACADDLEGNAINLKADSLPGEANSDLYHKIAD